MGAFELMNVTGIPIAVHASTTLGNELGPFYMTCEMLKTQKESGENWDLSGEIDEAAVEQIIDRFHGVALGVAAALVDEGVASIEDTDRGAKIGLRWIKGPFGIMNKIGIDKTHDVVSAICQKYPDFKMPQILEKQKQLGKPFEFNFVDLSIQENIATITINRPEAMNALNETVIAQLDEQFTKAEIRPEVDSIVFEGAGKAFVAGADIKYFIQKIKADRISDIEAFTRKGHALLQRIENSKKLTIALLDGLSLGGGSELALACQAILATPSGSMAFPETGIGIIPGLGGMLRLSRHVGEELAKYYTFTGFPLSAKGAQELGIVIDVVSPGQVASRIKALSEAGKPDKYRPRDIGEPYKTLAATCSSENVIQLLSGEVPTGVPEEIAAKTAKAVGFKAPLAIKMANEIIDAQKGKPIPEAIEIELNRLEEIFSTADALEGLSSLGHKRPHYKRK
jgi:enoyl-CoA hydratase/3-hydroxyacyl-CoA dehydrogenase